MHIRLLMTSCALMVALAGPSIADEGFWTFDRLPLKTLSDKYGFTPSPGWSGHLRSSAVRIAQGCSGSFVSGRGLVLTNQHCARDCAQALSTPGRDLVTNGFVAATAEEERRCPDLEIDQLMSITSVTDRLEGVTRGKSGPAFAAAQRAEIARIQAECGHDAATRCDVVTLFHGGHYDLYRYHRFQDVRLVFEAEDRAAAFGDPSKTDWPYYDFDVGMVRVYDGGQPIDTSATHLTPADAPTRAGDLVFIVGDPAATFRLNTVSQLAYLRDVDLATGMTDLAELHGMAAEAARESPALAQGLRPVLQFSELFEGRVRKQHEALTLGPVMADKVRAEQELRARVAADPHLQAQYGAAWPAIDVAVDHEREIAPAFLALDFEVGLPITVLFQDALLLVRHAREMAKPDAQRLRVYNDANLPALRAHVLSNAPINPDVEIRTTQWLLSRVQAHLGTAHPLSQALIGDEDERVIAARLIGATKLADPKVRQGLFDGGVAAIDASTDPLVVYVRDRWEPAARPLRRAMDEEVRSTIEKNAALIDRARLAVGGVDAAPDGTSTPRLSFGVVAGYTIYGRRLPAFTTLGDAQAHETGSDPFRLPDPWRAARDRLDPATPLDLVASVDAAGGNSGSPMIDRDGRLRGLLFATNDAGEANVFANNPAQARGIAVAWPAIKVVLTQAYGAKRLVDEMERLGGEAKPQE